MDTEKIVRWYNKLVCALIGHKTPYVAKLTADICGRCSLVMFDRTPPKYSAKLLELKKRSDRLKKKGF